MKVLITGATGYLGRAVVAALAASGHDVIAFARTASASALPVTAVDGDVRDVAALTRAATGCDAIIHTAALVAVWRRRSQEFDDVNVGGLRNVLAAALTAGVPRIVYTSSFLARPPAGMARTPVWNDYQRTKAAAAVLADEAVRNGSPLIRLFPGVIYGPGRMTDGNLLGTLVSDHLTGRLPGLVGADRTWSFAYVDDVAAAHVAAVERGVIGACYDVGGENAPPMRAFEIVRELTGRPLPRRLPTWAVAGVAFAEETLARWFGRHPRVTTGTLEILLHDWPLDNRRAEQDLGYRVTPLKEGIARMLASLQAAESTETGSRRS